MMKKKILFVLLALVFCATNAVAAGAKIAYVDTQRVFNETKLGKKYQGMLREYFKDRKKILDGDAEEIQKLQADFSKKAAVLKEKARKEKEKKIREKIAAFKEKETGFNKEIGMKNDTLSKKFEEVLMSILKRVAKKKKLGLILNKAASVGPQTEVPVVLYADEKIDLTEIIIAEIDKEKSK